MNEKMFQQGDVLIKSATHRELDGNWEKSPNLVLAEGEVTGHHHRIIAKPGEAELFKKGDAMLLRVLADSVQLVHEEHGPITIPQGEYDVSIVQEYDHFAEEARRVID